YRFIGPLGQGSMGAVFLAMQERLARRVAVKLLSRRYVRDKRYVDRFLYEAKLGAQTLCRHLPRVYDVGQAHGQYFMAMEYVEGESLADQLAAGAVFGIAEVIDLAVEVTHALEHLHGL